ncbi:hypothetical protein ABIE52_000117 [Rhodococcus sp. OAS809]
MISQQNQSTRIYVLMIRGSLGVKQRTVYSRVKFYVKNCLLMLQLTVFMYAAKASSNSKNICLKSTSQIAKAKSKWCMSNCFSPVVQVLDWNS